MSKKNWKDGKVKSGKGGNGGQNRGLHSLKGLMIEEEKPRRIPVENFTMMQVRQQVSQFIMSNQQGVLVVKVPTGGGKSLGLPWIVKEDIIPMLPETRTIMLEPLRMVTSSLRQALTDLVLVEKVGMKVGNDKGLNYHGERFTVATVGSAFGLIRKERPNITIFDEFDLDQNGDGAIMHNQLYHMLKNAEVQGERLIVILPSATPDLVNAGKFYGEFKFEVVEVEDRMFDPDILEVDLGSSSVDTFKDVLGGYTNTIIRLCVQGIEKDGKTFTIPVGKNILCTVPSPMYFEELEKKILAGVDPMFVEVVKVWSRSTESEKRKLFNGGTRGMITIFIATDLIRRGGTPEIYATFPSGWQVRDFCDPSTGIEGTREERASEADYSQDEGRCARKEKGLVVRSLDSRRPQVGMTFLERKPLETFLLNLIHYEDIRNFKWWGEVSAEKIDAATGALKRVGAAEEDERGRLVLTTLGKAMRGIPGSIQMRSMIFEAFERQILDHFLIISSGMSVGGLFANTKDKDDVKRSQAPLICHTSDYLSALRAWGAISESLIVAEIDRVVSDAHAKVNIEKKSAENKAEMRKIQILKDHEIPRDKKQRMQVQVEEELGEKLALIELGRQDAVEDAVMGLVRKISGRVAFSYGLYKKAVEEFAQNVIRSVAFLRGKKFSMNGHGEQTIHLDLMRILKIGPTAGNIEEAISDSVHKVVLKGYTDQIWVNIPHRGDLGYFYEKAGNGSFGSVGVFPGSACFGNYHDYLVGLAVDLKGKKFLKNVVMIDKEQLASWLPEVDPHLAKTETGLNPRFDVEKDCVVSDTRIVFNGKVLRKDEGIESPSHAQAERVFMDAFASGRIDDIKKFVLEKNAAVRAEAETLNIRSGGAFLRIETSEERKLYEAEILGKGIISVGTLMQAIKEKRISVPSLLLTPVSEEEKVRVETDNPSQVELEGEILVIEYSKETYGSTFHVRTQVTEEFARKARVEAVVLPSNRHVELRCSSHSSMNFPELVENLEKARIEREWKTARSQNECGYTENADKALGWLADACASVVVTRSDNGNGEEIVAWKAVVGYYEYHQWKLALVETLEKAEAETTKSIRTIFAAKLDATLVLPQEAPFQEVRGYYWRLTEIGEALKARFETLVKAPGDLTSENIMEKVEEVKAQVNGIKIEIGGRYVEFQQFVANKEAEIKAKVDAMNTGDRQIVDSEISQARQALEEAKISLKNSAFEDVEVACGMAVEAVASAEAKVEEIHREAERKAAELQARVESGEILINFEAYKRRMGASGNGDAWVITSDGSLRVSNEFQQRKHYPEGSLRWDVVEPNELALTWSCGSMFDISGSSEFKVAKLPVNGITPAQLEAVRKIEVEDIGCPENSFGLDPGASERREKFIGELVKAFPICPACKEALSFDEASYRAVIGEYGIQICSGDDRISRLINWSRGFEASTEGREAQVVVSRAISTGMIEALVYEKWGGWNLNLRFRQFREGEDSVAINLDPEVIGNGSFTFVGKRDFRCSCGGFAQVSKSDANAYKNGAEISMTCGKCRATGKAKKEAEVGEGSSASNGLDLSGFLKAWSRK